MTIEKARELLGDRAKKLNDSEILALVELTNICIKEFEKSIGIVRPIYKNS